MAISVNLIQVGPPEDRSALGVELRSSSVNILANGHGRYITVAPERALVSVGKWPLNITVKSLWPFHFRNVYVTAVSLLKPPCGDFRSETATWIQKWFKISVGTPRKLYIY
jgi:hypothetical protein